MTLALQAPDKIHDIISVDNAPIDAALLSSFGKYVSGMKKIEEAQVTKQVDADKILRNYEEVGAVCKFHGGTNLNSLLSSANFCWETFTGPLAAIASSSKFH